MTNGIIYDGKAMNYVSTIPGRVVLTSWAVVDILEVNSNGWNIGVVVEDLMESLFDPDSGKAFNTGQMLLFHNDEVL